MGYTALLFCPDEKTARTVTQVLNELEFAVEACTEPFAAVKKLMGQHFDGVVVDCDNEQNATLLFKSARNSTSNQTSLAVAVVEGQAGVAKAFRIGANLVLTKPINIEQSKGTLRVARGLLRKSEPAKSGGAAASPGASAAVSSKSAAPKPAPEPKSPPTTESPLFPEAASTPVLKPTPAWPNATAVASRKPAPQDDDLLDIESHEPVKTGAALTSSISAPILAADPRTVATSGAASAPAPAREVVEPKPAEKIPEDTSTAAIPGHSAATPESTHVGVIGSAPSFSFGTDSAESGSSGGGKKILIGVAALILVAAGLYGGMTYFRGAADQPKQAAATSAIGEGNASQPVSNSAKPAPSAEKPSATPTVNSQPSKPEVNKIQNIIDETSGEDDSNSDLTKPSSGKATESKPEAELLIVKGGKSSARPKAIADAPAPSMIGIANPGASEPPPNLVPTSGATVRPILSTVNVSQGVSTGLLIKKIAPSYPANALRMRVEGTVELQATISKDGTITHIKTLSGDAQLTKAATDAVKQWKYKPYLLNGEPVEIQTQVTVKFKLPQ